MNTELHTYVIRTELEARQRRVRRHHATADLVRTGRRSPRLTRHRD